jgi:F0F1-type ATP synthase membrane subunit b/b'
MLSNIKLVTLIIYFIITCGYIIFLRADNNSIKNELQKQTITLQAAQVLRDNQEAQLKRAEKEAQYLRSEALKQLDKIKNTKIGGGCEGAINWMIEQV